MAAVDMVPVIEGALNELIVGLRAEGKYIGFIHRVDGSITLKAHDREPGGTFYMGPVIAEIGGKQSDDG